MKFPSRRDSERAPLKRPQARRGSSPAQRHRQPLPTMPAYDMRLRVLISRLYLCVLMAGYCDFQPLPLDRSSALRTALTHASKGVMILPDGH